LGAEFEAHFTRDRNNTSLQPNHTHVTPFVYIDTRAFKLLSCCLNTISSKNSTRAGSENYVTGKILCVCGGGGILRVFAFEVCTDIPTSLSAGNIAGNDIPKLSVLPSYLSLFSSDSK
jgi:hypothetical protein